MKALGRIGTRRQLFRAMAARCCTGVRIPTGVNRDSKNDPSHTGICNRNDHPAPRSKCGALLAVVLPVFQPRHLSRLRVQYVAAMHGYSPRHRRLLLRQSVPSAARR
jgi:hypothetical protein